MVYGYCRVSSRLQAKDGNSLEAQEMTLVENGAEVIFKDVYTGTKMNRPELDKLMAELKSGDKLIVTKLDRIARSAQQGMEIVKRLQNCGIAVHVLNMGLIDDTPTGRLIAQIMFAFAEFERDMIIERTQEGKEIARSRSGYREGRPPKYTQEQLDFAVSLLDQYSYRQVEAKTGVNSRKLMREVRRRKDQELIV